MSKAINLTYEQVTKELGVEWDRSSWFAKGEADISRGIIYWNDRRVTRPGLRNFLKLYASIRLSHNRGQPEWQQIYEQNQLAYRVALDKFGIRFGAHLSKADRRRVRFLILDRKTGRVKVKPQPWGVYIWSQERT